MENFNPLSLSQLWMVSSYRGDCMVPWQPSLWTDFCAFHLILFSFQRLVFDIVQASYEFLVSSNPPVSASEALQLQANGSVSIYVYLYQPQNIGSLGEGRSHSPKWHHILFLAMYLGARCAGIMPIISALGMDLKFQVSKEILLKSC